MTTRSKEELTAKLHALMDKVEAENPFETFEPNESEEGKFDIYDLYESRLNKLFVMAIGETGDKELQKCFLDEIAAEIKRDQN